MDEFIDCLPQEVRKRGDARSPRSIGHFKYAFLQMLTPDVQFPFNYCTHAKTLIKIDKAIHFLSNVYGYSYQKLFSF